MKKIYLIGILGLLIGTILVSGCESIRCRNPDDCFSENPRKYGVFMENVEIDGYSDNDFMTDKEIEEVRQEVSEEHKDRCDNVRAEIIRIEEDYTDIEFYGDCYVSNWYYNRCFRQLDEELREGC